MSCVNSSSEDRKLQRGKSKLPLEMLPPVLVPMTEEERQRAVDALRALFVSHIRRERAKIARPQAAPDGGESAASGDQ